MQLHPVAVIRIAEPAGANPHAPRRTCCAIGQLYLFYVLLKQHSTRIHDNKKVSMLEIYTLLVLVCKGTFLVQECTNVHSFSLSVTHTHTHTLCR